MGPWLTDQPDYLMKEWPESLLESWRQPVPPAMRRHVFDDLYNNITDTTAVAVARTFVTHWVSNFGVPSAFTTDRGSQFEYKLFQHLTELLGCKHIHTTACHPMANSLVERFQKYLKTAIMAHKYGTDWSEMLPLILLDLRTGLRSGLLSNAPQ
ncbi:uncharacterized protein DEA37_0002248 [Paragonimus westermani]|uniref:Integrase catalytic domain-containing protein n=1 Tax=Paragonimus westermani TaxID=34504 RepID=A0A5J4NY05_9TREM|nr:uncharacterized protein DEA37_0002248 [Paragonimus westermani]